MRTWQPALGVDGPKVPASHDRNCRLRQCRTPLRESLQGTIEVPGGVIRKHQLKDR